MPDEVDTWYSWVVVCVCFVLYFLIFGMVQISGLFFAHVITYYDVDREWAFMPFLMGSVARAVSAPVCGYLSYTYGFRFAITLGSFFSFLGIFGCSFAQDINVFCVFWTIYGLGYGLVISILPSVINLFNKKHASKANGIALCGPSTSGIILPFLAVALLDSYGLPGTLLNLSALMLNCFPCILLLRDPASNSSKRTKDKFVNSCVEATLIQEEDKLTSESSKMMEKEKTCMPEDSKENTTPEESTILMHCENNLIAERDNKVQGNLSDNKCELLKIHFPEKNNLSAFKTTKSPDLSHISSLKRRKGCLSTVNIFWDPLFVTFSIVRCFCALLLATMPTILVDFFFDKGVPKNQESYVPVLYAAANLFAKICFGWITDSNYISGIKYVSLWFFIVALSFCVMVLSNVFVVIAAAVIFVSMGTSTIYPNLAVLIDQYFEKEMQSIIIPCLDIFLLPMSFGTSRLIGYFREDLGSYDGLAFTFGATSFVCSLLVLLIPRISSWRIKRKKNSVNR